MMDRLIDLLIVDAIVAFIVIVISIKYLNDWHDG